MTAFLATYLLYAVALGALIAWLLAPRPDKPAFAVAGVLASLVVGVLVKVLGLIWTDPRPFVVDHTTPAISHSADNGFPSDHTALATAVAFTVLARNRVIGLVLIGCSIVLAGARVAAGVHHVPDVIAGFGAGALAAFVGSRLADLALARLDRRRAAAETA